MKQTVYSVTIKGTTPYMQHRMDDEKLEGWEKRRGKIIERLGLNDPDEVTATFHSFLSEDGTFYMPSEHIRMSLINAGTFMKSKVGNARKNMSNIVAAMFFVNPDQISMPRFDVVDKRSAVNRMVKGRVIVKRPKWNDWKVTFNLTIEDDTITMDTVKDLFMYSGRYIGIGSYRPEHKGQFGRYEVENIQKQ